MGDVLNKKGILSKVWKCSMYAQWWNFFCEFLKIIKYIKDSGVPRHDTSSAESNIHTISQVLHNCQDDESQKDYGKAILFSAIIIFV